MLICCALTIACTAAMVATLAMGYAKTAGVVKMVGSTAFLGIAVAAGALQSPYGWLVLAGLFFSWWGDLFLIFRNETLFLLGLIVFFLAHVCYGAAFLVHGVNGMWTALTGAALLIPLAIVLRWLNPRLGEMRIPVYAYTGVISAMVALAAGAVGAAGTLLMPVAAVTFYVSDLFVARERFVIIDHWNRFVGLPLYYTAQILFAYSIALVP